jgi:hypothetical protein
MRLRTDIPVMDEAELEGWIFTVLRTIHKVDLEIIRDRINAAIDEDKQEMIKARKYKMCDKCNISYPYHIMTCGACGNEELRSFNQN